MKKLQKNLRYIANKLFVAEEYHKFLDLAARFPNMSVYNLLLLYFQMPTAILVAGENAWKDNYGLCIKENEKAICLLRPTMNEDEVISYSQVGVFDVSQLETTPEIKRDEFDIELRIHENTGCFFNYATEETEDILGDDAYVYLEEDGELIIKDRKDLSNEEKESYRKKQILKFYIERCLELSETDYIDLAVIKSLEYVFCKRYEYEAENVNPTILVNCKNEGLEYFIKLTNKIVEVVNNLENQMSIEFNFAETVFVDFLLEVEDKEDVESIMQYAIEDDDVVLNTIRDSFVEKLEMVSQNDYAKILEDRSNNKMMTQPPYKIKLFTDI